MPTETDSGLSLELILNFFKKYHEGNICLSACIQGELPHLLLNDMDDEACELALKYKNLFGPDHYYIELQDHGLADQKYTNEKMI